MEIKITTKQMLQILTVIVWIIFIGLCVDAGAIIFNTIFTFFINPQNANYYWSGADLLTLYHYDNGHFLVITSYMIIISVMKAIMFYLMIKVAHEKKISLEQPFSLSLVRFVSTVAYVAISIGIFSHMGSKYSNWLVGKSIVMPNMELLNFGGPDVWLLMGVALLVIVQIFKRGIEIQDEHELTV